MDVAQVSILVWAIFTLGVAVILLRYEVPGANGEDKLLIDTALIGWRRNEQENQDRDGPR
jgi:hypothetical protein